MNESTCKGEFVKRGRLLLPSWVIIRHEDRFTHGIPDISITGNRYTTWLEVKFANPDFKSKGIQELTMLRLAKSGLALYLVFRYTKASEKFTYMVNPVDIGKPMDEWRHFTAGFNYDWAIDYVRRSHDIGGT